MGRQPVRTLPVGGPRQAGSVDVAFTIVRVSGPGSRLQGRVLRVQTQPDGLVVLFIGSTEPKVKPYPHLLVSLASSRLRISASLAGSLFAS